MDRKQKCSRCILPETFPKITFSEEGVCNFCLDYEPFPVLGETKLREILKAGKGETYDCVVPISGGKDSTYALYFAVKILGLKAIAVNYDSGFQSDSAKENMRNTCRKLNVPLIVKEADYENHVKMLKEILRISEIAGSFFGICGNCEANIRTVAINTAKEYKAPLILYGDSVYESTGTHSFMGMQALIRKMHIRDAIKLSFHISRYCFYSVRQRIQMKVPIKSRFLPIGSVPFPRKGIRVIHFFDYIKWDSMNMASLLEEELGWKYPNGHVDRFDCLLHCFGTHHWLQACGISVDGFTYSNMIRDNRLERDAALLRERAIKESVEKECLETIGKIGLKDYKMPDF